jgi:ABC-type transporter Mla MlaB component
MRIAQHDGAAAFEFVLSGELSGMAAQQLEWAWQTARSITAEKPLIVDISGVTGADDSGRALLSRMRESGARLTAALPPASEDFLQQFGVPAAPRPPSARRWTLRNLARLRAFRNAER